MTTTRVLARNVQPGDLIAAAAGRPAAGGRATSRTKFVPVLDVAFVGTRTQLLVEFNGSELVRTYDARDEVVVAS